MPFKGKGSIPLKALNFFKCATKRLIASSLHVDSNRSNQTSALKVEFILLLSYYWVEYFALIGSRKSKHAWLVP